MILLVVDAQRTLTRQFSSHGIIRLYHDIPAWKFIGKQNTRPSPCRLVTLLPRTGYPPNITCTRLVASDPLHHSSIQVSPQAKTFIQVHSWSNQVETFAIIHFAEKTCNNISNESKTFMINKYHFYMLCNETFLDERKAYSFNHKVFLIKPNHIACPFYFKTHLFQNIENSCTVLTWLLHRIALWIQLFLLCTV